MNCLNTVKDFHNHLIDFRRILERFKNVERFKNAEGELNVNLQGICTLFITST